MNTNDSKSLHDRLSKTVRELPKSGIRDFFDIVSSMKDVISLGVGEPDFTTPWHIRESSVYALEHGATGYTSNLGLLKLRSAIARYLDHTFGVAYNPENEVMITVGVSEGLDLALRAIINPGDEVIYHEPAFVAYNPIIRMAGGTPVPVETRMEDDFRLSRAQLEEAVSPHSKALFLNYPNNPTGAALSADDVQEIADFVIDHDLLLITDEIYAELTYEGRHTSFTAIPGMKERTILLHGFSKAWAMTGFRVGFACAPPPLLDAMMKIHQYTMMCAPILSQEAALEALTQPDTDIGEMRMEYLRHRNFIHSSLNDMGLPAPKPAGAFYIFPSIRDTGLSSKDFALSLLQEENVAVVPGTAFGSCGEGFIRCSFATGLGDIKVAMERIGRFLSRHAQPRARTASTSSA